MSALLSEDQKRFTILLRDPRLTPGMMLAVMRQAMGLQPDLRRALPSEARKAPIGAVGIIAAWPPGALERLIAMNGLGPLCDALEERLALIPEGRRYRP